MTRGVILPACWRFFLPLSFNGIGVGLGGLIGFGIGHIKGALQSWRYEFLVVGAVCAAWGISLSYTLANSPTRHRGFTHDERLMIIARLKRNQTGIENRVIKWDQIREAFLDYKTWIFFSLGLIGVSSYPERSFTRWYHLQNIPNGGISNFSTLVIQGLGFSRLETSLMALPQGALVMIFILTGAFLNDRLPKNSRTLVCMLFMLPTIAGGLGFLLAPEKAYVARLICLWAVQ
jgi:MFS family permease